MNRKSHKLPRLKLVAIAEDEATGEFIAVIDFRDINNCIRRLEQPRSTLRKIDSLREQLENAGASLPMNDQKARAAIKGLSKSVRYAERWKYAPDGMTDTERSFCRIA